MQTGRFVPDTYYASGEALRAKHARLTGPAAEFPVWAVERLDLGSARLVVDAGCGWGRFALPALASQPDLALVAVDVWPGMVASCREAVGATPRASYVTGDVGALPLRTGSADAAMANHMLYELDDPDEAIAELARVLRPGGRLLATTYADEVRVPLVELHHAALAAAGLPSAPEPPSTFSLENGEGQLRRRFARVEVHVLDEPGELTPAGVDGLVATYRNTGRFGSVPPDRRAEVLAAFAEHARAAVEREGTVCSTTRWTAFVATR